ncbi:MAG: App1 family protein [Verrucomicrobia subdivision 3 bacterium]|nr:App1 family protein [Limisphaerales bacterium]
MKELAFIAMLALCCHGGASAGVREDERIVFFPTYAFQTKAGWMLNVHGWVYEPEERPVLGVMLRRAIPIDRDKLTSAERLVYRERTRYFLPDNERGKLIAVQAGALRRTAPPTQANGHFKMSWQLSDAQFDAFGITNGMISVAALLDANDARAFTGAIHVLSNRGISVVSDIDDTIKVSEVRDQEALLLNTFCRPFKSAPRMAKLYAGWQAQGAQFHYVSASPWQLYPALAEFVRTEGFPPGTFHMKALRLKDSTFLALFNDPIAYKLAVLEPLIAAFPDRKFVLAGDSGEKDPEIYAKLAERFPTRIEAVLIRNVTGETRQASRYRAVFRRIPSEKWHVFTEPSEIPRLTLK